MKQKNTLAVSAKAATDIFMRIASAPVSTKMKGKLMMLASRMIEDPASVGEDEFAPLHYGEIIFALISAAAVRSRRAREVAALRRSRSAEPPKINPIEPRKPEIEPFEQKSERPSPRPARHPRLGIKCRYLPPLSERKKRCSRPKVRKRGEKVAVSEPSGFSNVIKSKHN